MAAGGQMHDVANDTCVDAHSVHGLQQGVRVICVQRTVQLDRLVGQCAQYDGPTRQTFGARNVNTRD